MGPAPCLHCGAEYCPLVRPDCVAAYEARVALYAKANGSDPGPHRNRAEARRSWRAWRKGAT